MEQNTQLSKIDISQYLHLYIGCQLKVEYGYEGTRKIGILTGYDELYGWQVFRPDVVLAPYLNVRDELIKPILRPLSDMTKEEALHFAWLCNDSKHHLEEDCRISKEEIDIELAKNDNGLLLDADVEIYIGVTVRCFEGAVIIKKDGSISIVDENNEKQEPVDEIADKVRWLLSKHFDLFNLIPAGLAIDKSSYRQINLKTTAMNQYIFRNGKRYNYPEVKEPNSDDEKYYGSANGWTKVVDNVFKVNDYAIDVSAYREWLSSGIDIPKEYHSYFSEDVIYPEDAFEVIDSNKWYLAVCKKCGWKGSSERCGVCSYGDDADVVCPNCGSHDVDSDESFPSYEGLVTVPTFCEVYKKWLIKVKQEQNNYPMFKGRELDEEQLKELWKLNKSPIEALNDLGTLC